MRKLYEKIPVKYRHWTYVLLLIIYLITFFIAEHVVDGTGPYWPSYIPLDDKIPFCEFFLIPYLLWFPFIAAVAFFLVFRDPHGFKKFMMFMGGGMFVAVIFMLLFPNGQDLRPEVFERDNLFTDLMRWIYAFDTNTNVLPSLHVVGTMGCVFALFESPEVRSRFIKAASVVFGILICLATVFLKQHSALDSLVGIPYGVLVYIIVYHWLPPKRIDKEN